MLWFFGPEACGILAPQPGIKHVLLRLEGEILPTGSPGKSQLFILFFFNWSIYNAVFVSAILQSESVM